MERSGITARAVTDGAGNSRSLGSKRRHRGRNLAHGLDRLLCLLGLAIAPVAAQAAAGTITGKFDVGPDGPAEYIVPITVPPGTAGMAPQLSLMYSSTGGNGLLGLGWQMAGLSQISRCPATLAQDGFTDGVNLDENEGWGQFSCSNRLNCVNSTACSREVGIAGK